MANDTLDTDDNGDLAQEIADYREQFTGTQTVVEAVDYPEPDEPWLQLLTWLIARVDEGTVKQGSPSDYSDAGVTAFVFDDSGSSDSIALVGSEREDVIIADTDATETAKNLSIVEDSESDTVELRAETSGGIVTLAGNSTSSTDGNDLSDDPDVENDAVTFPEIPLIDKSTAQIENDYNIPMGGMAYSLEDGQLLVNLP